MIGGGINSTAVAPSTTTWIYPNGYTLAYGTSSYPAEYPLLGEIGPFGPIPLPNPELMALLEKIKTLEDKLQAKEKVRDVEEFVEEEPKVRRKFRVIEQAN